MFGTKQSGLRSPPRIPQALYSSTDQVSETWISKRLITSYHLQTFSTLESEETLIPLNLLLTKPTYLLLGSHHARKCEAGFITDTAKLDPDLISKKEVRGAFGSILRIKVSS